MSKTSITLQTKIGDDHRLLSVHLHGDKTWPELVSAFCDLLRGATYVLPDSDQVASKLEELLDEQ